MFIGILGFLGVAVPEGQVITTKYGTLYPLLRDIRPTETPNLYFHASNATKVQFIVNIATANGLFGERVYVVKKGAKWVYSARVYKSVGYFGTRNVLIRQWQEPDLPNDFDWSKPYLRATLPESSRAQSLSSPPAAHRPRNPNKPNH
jgi:hypothetical protein